MKTITMFIITIFKGSRKVEINRNYVSKCVENFLCIKRLFPDIAKFADFRQKILMSAELKSCVT